MKLSLSLCVAATAVAFCQGFTTPMASTSTTSALNSAAMGPWTMMPDEPQPEVSVVVFDYFLDFHSTCRCAFSGFVLFLAQKLRQQLK
jgi:hypothetical protein